LVGFTRQALYAQEDDHYLLDKKLSGPGLVWIVWSREMSLLQLYYLLGKSHWSLFDRMLRGSGTSLAGCNSQKKHLSPHCKSKTIDHILVMQPTA